MKTQLIVDKKSKKIISINVSKGRVHDLKMFEQSETLINPLIEILADSGYQGIQVQHANTTKPIKSSKKKKLEKEKD